MSQADSTRARILEAATQEFARHGIAGARVDRIATRSGMSKPMIYTYFGSKDRLFDAAFDSHVVANGDRVPFSVRDLPGYAALLYDDYIDDPALMRLIMWKRLERDEDGYLYGGHESLDDEHLDDIAGAQREGRIRADLDPSDVWSILIATAATWAQNSVTVVATGVDQVELHARRRQALRTVVSNGLLEGGDRAVTEDAQSIDAAPARSLDTDEDIDPPRRLP